MAICVNDSGTWRKSSTICTNTSGTWRKSNNVCIRSSGTWRLTFGPPAALGSSYGGGYVICFNSGVGWIVAPSSTEVPRYWFMRGDAVTRAQASAACNDWFVPDAGQLQNPGWVCRTYWDAYCGNSDYWTNNDQGGGNPNAAYYVRFSSGVLNPWGNSADVKYNGHRVRAFRCVTY